MKRTVYVISGPAGAGKSTTSRKIAEILPRSAYIEGDDINHMVIGGHEKPWLSQFHLNLIWLNIVTLTKNFLNNDHDVIIDYVTFYDKVEYLLEELEDFEIIIKFIILIVDKEELLKRDSQRMPEDQIGERCIIGLNEILQSNPSEYNMLDTTNIEVDRVVEEILNNSKYIIKQ